MADPTFQAFTDPTVGKKVGTESSLSNWAGDYVTDMLGRGWAMADQPYQTYEGPLTAGPSNLQSSAFSGIAGLTLPEGFDEAASKAANTFTNAGTAGEYDPTNIGTKMWDTTQADAYMSPYIQKALEPQLAEMSRQSQIQRLKDNAGLTKAGAYGGSRQAVMNSEQNDNMMRLMSELTGKGYQDAYESAGKMFTSDQARDLEAQRASEQSKQFGSKLGLEGIAQQLDANRQFGDILSTGFQGQRDILGDQLRAGDVERGITSEGIGADISQFEHERDYPYKQVQYMQSLLDGLPLGAQSTSYGQPSTFSNILSGTGGIMDIYDTLFGGSGGNTGNQPSANTPKAALGIGSG